MYNRDMPLALTYLIWALATARLVGIATGKDEITRPYLRGTETTPGFAGRVNPQDLEHGWRHLVAYLATCQWCASIWVGLLVTAPLAYWHGTDWWALLPALGLAFSQVAGMTSNTGRD